MEPKLVIGMPVYNGEGHLREALESLLGQTFGDFVLLISDNCSTDGTSEICNEFAERDGRVDYHRQQENLGMAGNFNYVFQPGNAPYFKWTAHDDLHEPEYLASCLDLLDNDPSLAIAHSPAMRIDGDGNLLGVYRDLGMSGDRIRERFWRVLWSSNMYEMYGVMRSEMVAKAKPVDVFFGAERNTLAEVLLQGNIAYVDKPLFSRRDHDASLTAMHMQAKADEDFGRMLEAHAPEAKMSGARSSVLKAKQYASSILRFPMPLEERVACFSTLTQWALRRGLEDSTGVGKSYRWKLADTHALSHPNVIAQVEQAMQRASKH